VGGGLLAVHAHPDDETLSTGALLATWASAGLPVTLVTCTRGEQGEVIGERHSALDGDGAALGAHRTRELTAATSALGVRDQLFLDDLADGETWVDTGMVWDGVGRARVGASVPEGAFARVDVDRAAAALATLLRDRRPAVVVTYEPEGGYGHPDHVQAHRVTMRAVELAAEAGWTVPCVLWAALDARELRRGYRECAGLSAAAGGLALPDPDGPLPTAAVPDGEIDVDVLVRPVLARIVAAMAAHETQVQAVHLRAAGAGLEDATPGGPRPASLGVFALSNDVLQPLLAHESYRCGRGGTGQVSWPPGVLVR